jgi:hypothetical protein
MHCVCGFLWLSAMNTIDRQMWSDLLRCAAVIDVILGVIFFIFR